MARQFSTSKSKLDPKPQAEKDDSIIAPEFPDEWISIAAYYIGKNEGEREGRETDYRERAKAELTNLWQEGNLPTKWHSANEER